MDILIFSFLTFEDKAKSIYLPSGTHSSNELNL